MEEKLFFRCFLLITLVFNVALCSELPVFFWGGRSLEKLPYVSAMKTYKEKQFQNDFVELLLKSKETLIVYSQDTLSLEDFIHSQENDKNFHYLKSALDKEPSLIIPSVVNPAQSLFKLNKNYKIKQFYLNESFVDDIVSAAEKNDIIILHSSDNDEINRNLVLNKLDDLMKKVEMSSKNLKKSITYLFTGYNPSWDKTTDESRIFRHLLAVENVEKANFTLLNFSDCGLLYTKNVFWEILHNSSQGEDYLANSTTTIDVENSDCKPTNESVQFIIKMNIDGTKLTSASLKLLFNTERSDWLLEDVTFSFTSDEISEDVSLLFSQIDAPRTFSYSCYKTIFQLYNKTDVSGNITFDVFQVQPFKIHSDNFAESFDCVTFFTIPIWMGFMVVILLTAILAFGIYMLFNIHTMDRFDDPKGKPLSVPTAD